MGAGPGDPELLTVKAHGSFGKRKLCCTTIWCPQRLCRWPGAQAEVVNVGKRCGAKRITQDEINARMIERGTARVRAWFGLKSGDPGIFGRLAEEMEALDAAGIPYEVVPGITAGIAAAASLGVS